MKIKIKLDPGAAMPQYAHPSDVGADVKALHTCVVQGDGTEHNIETIADCLALRNKRIDVAKIKIDTGVHATPPDGYYLELVPNSRLSKTPFMYANSFGVIDPGYTGSMRVILNTVNSITPDDLVPFLPGRVVGQLILRKQERATFTEVDELEETERGAGGFGSTERSKA
jgi:dUTP pyrophosphatase